MPYAKQPPIRVTLVVNDCNLLIEGLKNNEIDYTDYIREDAQSLREKIETHGRRETSENGGEVVRLCFFENEGRKFIWQFIAAVATIRDLHTEIASQEELHEAYETLIVAQKRYIKFLSGIDLDNLVIKSGDDDA